MSLPNNIISPQHNRPLVGPVQEAMTLTYLITRQGVIVSRAQAQQIITATFPDESTEKIASRISSLFRRLARTRAESVRPDGVPHYQHMLDNATQVLVAELYERNASRDLQRYQERARSVLAEQYWQQQVPADRDEQTWLYERFAEQQQLSTADRQLLNTATVTPRSQELQQAYENWYVTAATIPTERVKEVVEVLLRQEVAERHYLTGRELFSIVYPEDYFYSRKNEADALEPVVKVEEGIHVSGQHTKATVGATHGSMVGDLFKIYSPAHAEDFITRLKWLVDEWGRTRGQSLTLYNCMTQDPDFSAKLSENIASAKADVFRLGPRSNNPFEEARRQELIREKMCNVKNVAGKLAIESIRGANPPRALGAPPIDPHQLNSDNSLTIMADSGAKGNKENISSMVTMVGQQDSQGRPIGTLPGGRSIPSFERNSRDPAAAGFVGSNYVKGMTATEFYLHQMAVREGLFGTALKTADTGYMQRRLVKAMEDAVVQPDNTVRNAQGVVIQYAYGEDGFSGDQLVMTQGKTQFIDAKRLLQIIQARRKRGLPALFKPSTTPVTRELPRPGFVMPSFEPARKRIGSATVEEEEEEDSDEEEKEEGEEEEEEQEEDASDLSEVEEEERED